MLTVVVYEVGVEFDRFFGVVVKVDDQSCFLVCGYGYFVVVVHVDKVAPKTVGIEFGQDNRVARFCAEQIAQVDGIQQAYLAHDVTAAAFNDKTLRVFKPDN